jgi:hypothetical protein
MRFDGHSGADVAQVMPRLNHGQKRKKPGGEPGFSSIEVREVESYFIGACEASQHSLPPK